MNNAGSVYEIKAVPMEEDCDFLIDRLSEELAIVKEHLAAITHGLESKLAPSSLQLSTLYPDCEDFSLTHSDSNLANKEDDLAIQKKSKGTPAHLMCTEDEVGEVKMKDLLKRVDDREQEREELYKRRLILMKCHIEQQLKELREKDSFLTRVREKRMRKERALKQQKKPPRFRSSGESDTDYMMKVYRSAMYQAMSLEHNLKKSGKLKKPSDIQYFWDYMFNLDSSSPVAAKEKVPSRPQPLQLFHQKTLISVEEEDEEDYNRDYTNSWAITAQLPYEVENSLPSSSFQASSNEFSHDKLPKLKSVQEILGDPIKKRYNIMKRQGSEKWEGQLKMQHMQIQKAHECSKANEILMRTHFSSMLQNIEHSLSSPPAVVGHLQAIQLPPSHDTPLTSFVVSSTSQGLVPHSQLSTTATSVSPSPSISITPETTASLRKRGSKSESLAPTTNVQAVPLSMSALMKTSKVLEIKTKSTMWKNYALTGTS